MAFTDTHKVDLSTSFVLSVSALVSVSLFTYKLPLRFQRMLSKSKYGPQKTSTASHCALLCVAAVEGLWKSIDISITDLLFSLYMPQRCNRKTATYAEWKPALMWVHKLNKLNQQLKTLQNHQTVKEGKKTTKKKQLLTIWHKSVCCSLSPLILLFSPFKHDQSDLLLLASLFV